MEAHSSAGLETGPIISKAGLFQKKKPFSVFPRFPFELIDPDCSGIPGDERIRLLEKLPELQPRHTVLDFSIPMFGETRKRDSVRTDVSEMFACFQAFDTDIDPIKPCINGKPETGNGEPPIKKPRDERFTPGLMVFELTRLCFVCFDGVDECVQVVGHSPHRAPRR